ncbi:TonB-dependent receptor [Alkalitalea saponilacus]|uniref:TonB-dependent receptor n=2 Tax=Alkalitalea saponilacus TaxID=889453 RepID=A0A1T5ATZ3_9BACT|nr:TonB-dependent receptor [Alkalitalea saponilacus]
MTAIAGVIFCSSLKAEVNPTISEISSEMDFSNEVSGRVSELGTGERLVGATVVVKDLNIGTSTDLHGSYRLRNLPEGRHTLVVSYLGYETREIELEVKDGEVINMNTDLEQRFLTMGEVLVTSVMRGQSRAFNQQKEAENVRNIVSSQQIERFPDNNITEAVKRIPGISTEPLRGEAAAIMIRGLPASFHTVTINNQRVASTDETNRATNTAIINTDMVSAIEVSKTITPDMDADALSGSINLVTRRPVGDNKVFNVTAGSGYNNMSGRPQWIGSATYGQRDGNLDWVVSANYQKDNRATEDIRHDWGVQDFGNGNQDVLAGLRPSFYETERQRMGMTGQVEYHFSPRSSIYFMGNFNNYDEYEVRNDARHGISNGTYETPDLVTGARYEKVIREYNRITDLYSLNAGGKHDIGIATVDYNIGYSYGSFDIPLREYYAFRHSDRPDYRVDISDREFGMIEFANDFNPNDYEKMNFRYYERRNDDVKDNDLFATFNMEVPYELGRSSHFKFGGKFWTKTKERNMSEWRWTGYNGPENLTMAMFAEDKDRNMIDNRYSLGGSIDWERGKQFFNDNINDFVLDEDRFRENSDPNNYKANERIFAAYALTDNTFGNVHVNAGVRMEQVSNTYDGFRVIFDDGGDYLATEAIKADDQNYVNFFPMLNVKYQINPLTNFRFAYTNSIARPDFEYLVPYELVNSDSETVSQGNPDLEPSTSMNLDLMFEHFLSNVGILSAGVFYKNMGNFIYNESTVITEGNNAGYRLNRPENGESAYLYGIELAWQQQLTFLPGVLSGLGVYANYSHIYSEAKIIVPEERRIRLPKQAPNIFNVALSYDRGGFSGQISYSYRDTWLHSVGGSSSAPSVSEHNVYLDRFLMYSGQLDLTLNQQITPNLRVFANFNNLTNQSHQHYFNDPIYPYRNSFHSWWSNFGIRYSL